MEGKHSTKLDGSKYLNNIFYIAAARKCFSDYLARHLNKIIDGIAETQSIEPTIEITPRMIENGIKKY